MAELDVLVVGSGGREHELARQMDSSPNVHKVYIGPGNAGTALLSKGENVTLQPTDIEGIVAFVRDKKVGAVIIGPDAAMEAGLANALRKAGVPVFGPNREAAKLESSKAFAAEFMTQHSIPQPQSWTAHSEQEALDIIKNKSPDTYVLKADGLAAGKGVVLPQTAVEAKATLADMFSGTAYDGAGKNGVVIQERLHGPEVSAFAVSDGTNFVMLPFSQDHKRLKDGDQGPNTGGMGAYSPLPENIVSAAQAQKIHDITKQTIDGMKAAGTPYQGVLYLGLMLAIERGGDPVVIEYNARFGDPETQVVLPVLSESGFDVPGMLLQAAKGDIAGIAIPSKLNVSALTVCVAVAGYPEHPRKGDAIEGLGTAYHNVIVQLAGVKKNNETFVANGGRVLYVTGLGKTPDEAAKAAYAAVGPHAIHFKDMHYRTDIGHQIRTT
ncbi:MAG TPA: phosphoribosylamine--glycine ligase [Nevskiaceae bacterium]|nr:phosphoribosylamine--glycine ligase [Nevskiaceae bacterium]